MYISRRQPNLEKSTKFKLERFHAEIETNESTTEIGLNARFNTNHARLMTT